MRTCCFIGEWEVRGLCSGLCITRFVLEFRAMNGIVFGLMCCEAAPGGLKASYSGENSRT